MNLRRSALSTLLVAVVASCAAPGSNKEPTVVPGPTTQASGASSTARTSVPPGTSAAGETARPQAAATFNGTPDPRLIALEELLPESLDGYPIQRITGNAVAVGTGGDVCMIFCPGDLYRLADHAGVPVDEVVFALGLLVAEDQAVVLRAIHLPGAEQDRVQAWLKVLDGSGGSWSRTARTIEGRAVTIALDPLRDDADGVQYIVAVGDVLFVYSGQPVAERPEDDPIAAILEALRQLPS